MSNICYFDNAATTFPKPLAVVSEIERCMRCYSGNPGRGSHRMALWASEKLYETRELAADLFNISKPERVVFTMNTTQALNIAIRGLIKEKSHVLLSDLEHNSTLRVVEYLKRTKGVEYSIFSTDGDVIKSMEMLMRKNTSAVICTHGSNITNVILPLERIGAFARKKGLIFIVDAAQTAGTHTIDMEKSHISALCVPGHKGLLGPQGVGMAIFSPDVYPIPLIYGGSGSLSESPYMPDILPDRLEAGTMPTPCIAGLCEGMKYILKTGVDRIFEREALIMESITKRFERDGRIVTYSRNRGPIWLFNVRGVSSQETARLLDEYGVCVRPGLHCAPLAHKKLGTPKDGAVRVSAGPFNSCSDADMFCASLERVIRELKG